MNLPLPEMSPANAAQIYLELGFQPVPVYGINADGSCQCGSAACAADKRKRGKHPIGAEWQLRAPQTKEQAAIAFANHHGNLGLYVDKTPFVVLDFDGPEGADTLAALTPRATLRARSGSGGTHLFYRLAANHDASEIPDRSKIRPGMDVKKHGQVLAAPSRHVSGGSYSWVNDEPIAMLPDELYIIIRKAPYVAPVYEMPRGDMVVRARAYLATMDPGIQGEDGSGATFKAARKLVQDFRLPDSLAWSLLCEFNERCLPPWSESELRHKFKSAKNAHTSNPVQDRPRESRNYAGSNDVNQVPVEERPLPYRIYTAAEIFKPLPPLEYVIDSILPKSSLMLMIAYGSSLKTWLALQALVAVAAGVPWLGHFECRTGRALYIDWESGDRELFRRIQAIAAADGASGSPNVEAITMPFLFFSGDDFEHHIRELAKDRDLIVFDTLSAGTLGVDENAAEFASGLNTLKRLGQETGCAFIVLHHSRKQGPNGGGDEREAARGTGAVFAAADVVLQMTRKGDEGIMLLRQTKARGGKSIEPMRVRLEDVMIEGQPAALVRGVWDSEADTPADEPEAANLPAVKAKVVQLIARDRDVRTANDVHRRIKGRKATVINAVRELLERDVICLEDGRFVLVSDVE